MAYATLLSLTQTLEFILNPPHHDQSSIRHQKLIKSLHEKFRFLLSFMEEDFAHTKSKTMTRLEKRIREMAYNAVHKIESQVSDGSHRFKSKDLQKIMEQVDSVSAEVVKMKDSNVTKNHPPTKFSPVGLLKSGHVDKSPIVGFSDELLAIKERLFTPPPKLAIISIIGMGGIGKTTLARTIFNDSKIVSHFDARGWLTVSQNYDVQDMLGRLLKSIGRNDTNEVNDLGQSLYKSLKQKRYLVVLDDVWDIKAWDNVKRFFPRDNTGSRIILTTRLLDVAVDADSSSSIYRPSLLSLNDSWKLLRQKVFGEESCPRKLERIGKEIAQNCKGLPLALAVIGGLLSRGDRKLDYWKYIQQNINSALADADDDFMEILALSYYQLPHQLRASFLYMSVFPEDYEVPKSELIKLWVAEGFVRPHSSKSLEEVAHEYLQDLVDRNMILVREWNTIGGIKSCGIHDLVRDLCTRITQEEKFLRVTRERIEKPFRIGRGGHSYTASIPSNNPDYRNGIYGSQARSFLCFDGTHRMDPLFSFILSFQQPKVLHARGEFSELPLDIANLRFLAVTKWESFNLNASVSKLLHLETLIVDSNETITLPMEIWNMPRLKHISTEGCFFPYPSGAKNRENFILSKNLQTLKGVENSSSTKDVLWLMPNLKTLKIIFYGVTGTKLSSYLSKYFIHLDQLKHLYCLFNDTKPLVENFRLPSSLSKFTLDCCSLSSKTMAIIGLLPNLQVLNVRECHFVKKVWEPTEGEFDQLKSLLLYWSDLKYFKADETSFPNLECLRIVLCLELKRIPSPIGDIPTLQLIDLDQSTTSAEKSALRIRKEQEEMGNENLKIIIRDLDEDEDEDKEEDNEDDEENENKEDAADDEEDEEDDGEDNDDNEEDDEADNENDTEDDEDDEEDNEDDREDDDDNEEENVEDEESSEDDGKYKNDSEEDEEEKDDYDEDEEDEENEDDDDDEEEEEDEDDDSEDTHNRGEDDEEDVEDSDNDYDDTEEDEVDEDDEEDNKKDEKRTTRMIKRTK